MNSGQTSSLNKPVRVAMVTNIPAPYRTPIYKRLADRLGFDNFHVIFCADTEANRDWDVAEVHFAGHFLKKKTLNWRGRFIHFNVGVYRKLKELKPDMVITTGFNPTHLLAFIYALRHGIPHIPMTDGTWVSEQKLTFVHRLIRRWVYKRSKTFIGASQGSFQLYKSYHIQQNNIFQSHLCANNAVFLAGQQSRIRPFDLMFSGRFAPEKNPLFALQVAEGVAAQLNRPVSILMLGSGPLLTAAKELAASLAPKVLAEFPGFLQQSQLPDAYFSAAVFLFPSSWDPWGVVANEACAAGQVVIVSPHAGVAGDLVCHNENGYVLELSLPLWVEHCSRLLTDESLRMRFAESSLKKVQTYNYDAAAEGVLAAIAAASAQQ